MKSQAAKSASNIVLSRQVLEETPASTYRFLIALNHPAILGAMKAAGYSNEDHLEGWNLFLNISNAPTAAAPIATVSVAAKAIAEIKGWNGQGFRRARAVLDHKFPAVSEFIFAGIDGSELGPVFDLMTFLDRCKDLENGADRKATRKTDHAALAALASRGIGDAELKRLRALTDAARTVSEPTAAPPSSDERAAAITELYLWLRDWRETARAVIKNRTHLRMLGIGGKKGKKVAAPVASPVVVTPVAPSAPQLTAGTPANDAVAKVG